MTALRPLLTPWGERLDPDHPLPEYPRPQLVRDSYLNLNGRWQYAFTATESAPDGYDGDIVVPFSPEAPLSGVNRQLTPGQVLHYRRAFRLPGGFAEPGGRVLLHFGAVDQWCRVTVNGLVVGEHTGGYLPFRFDITDALGEGENELAVVVRDPSDTGPLSFGKQRLARGGIWYTAQSGIWQTVWLEAVPSTWIEEVTITPDLPGETVELVVTCATAGDAAPADSQPVDVEVLAEGDVVARTNGRAGEPMIVRLPNPRPWSPDDPFLYDVAVSCGKDSVRSYVGMRSIGIGTDAGGRSRLMLNGEPYFHAGVLDQGYWPDGLYTAPSDTALSYDVKIAKELGFTMIRKHIKVEPLRWYTHCDRLGILVWQDMVNGGHPYAHRVITVPGLLPVRLDDTTHERFGRADPRGREHWLAEAEATVRLLRNSPSVVVWVPFNEGWGPFDSAAVTGRLRALDRTRLVDSASGWHDQGAGDFDSRHVYVRRFRPRRRRPGDARVLALTEYGGYSRHLPEHSSSTREFGYRRYSSGAALARALRRLHDRQIVPAIRAGLSATVYTQLADVEDETNGLMTADRRLLKLPGAELRVIFERLRLPRSRPR